MLLTGRGVVVEVGKKVDCVEATTSPPEERELYLV
jgi:hypothetical protein